MPKKFNVQIENYFYNVKSWKKEEIEKLAEKNEELKHMLEERKKHIYCEKINEKIYDFMKNE